MFIEKRNTEANTPLGWANTLNRDHFAHIKLRFDPRWSIIRANMAGPILDAGCGRGDWVSFLVSRGIDAVGLDYSNDMIQANRTAFPELRFEQGRIQQMPFIDSSFNGIVSWGVIEHDESGPQAALREFARVLRKGGKALVTVPEDSNQQRRASQLEFPAGSAFFQHFFTIDELEQQMSSVGFNVIKSGHASRPHPALIWPDVYQKVGAARRRLMQARAILKPAKFGNMIYCLAEMR